MDAVPTETTTIVCLLTPYCFSVYIDISIDIKNVSMEKCKQKYDQVQILVL